MAMKIKTYTYGLETLYFPTGKCKAISENMIF